MRFALVIIFEGPLAPKFTADTCVVSENVGDGGPGEVCRLELKDKERSDLGAMTEGVRV